MLSLPGLFSNHHRSFHDFQKYFELRGEVSELITFILSTWQSREGGLSALPYSSCWCPFTTAVILSAIWWSKALLSAGLYPTPLLWYSKESPCPQARYFLWPTAVGQGGHSCVLQITFLSFNPILQIFFPLGSLLIPNICHSRAQQKQNSFQMFQMGCVKGQHIEK